MYCIKMCVCTRVRVTITFIRNHVLHAHRISILSLPFQWLSLQTHVASRCVNDKYFVECKLPIWAETGSTSFQICLLTRRHYFGNNSRTFTHNLENWLEWEKKWKHKVSYSSTLSHLTFRFSAHNVNCVSQKMKEKNINNNNTNQKNKTHVQTTKAT